MNNIETFISNTYGTITFLHPSFWFSSRPAVAWNQLAVYAIFVFLLLALSIFFFFLGALQGNRFLKKFYQKVGYLFLGFVFLAAFLTFFRFIGLKALSARVVWIPFFFAMFFVGFLSVLEFTKKIPEKVSRFEADQIKKRYLRPFRRKK